MTPNADSGGIQADVMEAYVAGVISTYPPMSSQHPAECLRIAKAVLAALEDWSPDASSRSEP
ncbi:MAG: hypothetical protein J2P57_19865 [Acidimicrobiaceae bacterium]|nr:hypothetical protein [Acidimicrobiaceae bacterium]